jgi:importin subunit beta-1
MLVLTHSMQYATPLMQHAIFNAQHAGLHEEAMLAVGALASAIGADFERYMSAFLPYLVNGLQNHQFVGICIVSLNTVGDLAIALKEGFVNYTDKIMQVLVNNLHANIDKEVKPLIITAFGDIALALRGQFEKYLNFVAEVLSKACQAQVDTSDAEMIEYLNTLRENIFDAYTSILIGLKKDNPGAFAPYVESVLNFVKLVAQDEYASQEVFNRGDKLPSDDRACLLTQPEKNRALKIL